MKTISTCLKYVAIVLVSLSLSSCSTFSFLFDKLPWLSAWQLSRMFDLSDEQEVLVEDAADDIKSWFITEGFPALIVDLELASQHWSQQSTPEVVSALFDDLNKHLDRTLSAISPRFTPLVLSLTKHNLAHFQDYMEDKRSDWFESLSSEEDKEEKRIEQLEEWFGDLSDSQVLLVRQHIALLPEERSLRQANSEHWVERFFTAVRNQDSSSIQAWLAEPSRWWTSEYAALRDENRHQIDALINDLVPTLSDRQKTHANDEVQDWIEELRDVSQGD